MGSIGPQGPIGPSEAYTNQYTGAVALANQQWTPVGQLALTPGSYVLWGRVNVAGNSDPILLSCSLGTSTSTISDIATITVLPQTGTYSAAPGGALTLVTVANLAASDNAVVMCYGSGSTAPTVYNVRITAIRVGTLTLQ
jgi:hypothetical protein